MHVVVIDDDPDLRKLIKMTLEFTAGWDVSVAADGVEGIETVRRVLPDAVIADVMMPGMHGYEVCRRLRADPETSSIPVVLLTARREMQEAEAVSAGAAGIAYKPFEPEELATRIKELCVESKA